ncbi:MAG TPA: TetR/AcrR family transcriptional regulator [Pseudonocardiaceae bacterium]|nr:TetR/AcrR family transcriptional regulator [Pseudonocardiaceae bacterium]
MGTTESDDSSRERILLAAGELFAESGFDATPTSRIAERANVPKGLVHYYFRRKPDLLVALIDRLPDEHLDIAKIVVPGDVAASLRALVAVLDRRIESSRLLSHLLWREADTHEAVRDAMQRRYRSVVAQIRAVIATARGAHAHPADTDSAAELLALAVSYRHAVSRHTVSHYEGDGATSIDQEINFIAAALALGASS